MNIEDIQSNETNVEKVMEKVFDKQLELIEKYKKIEGLPDIPLNIDLAEHQIVIKDFKQRGMEEIAEAIEAFRKDEMEHFKEELIDALHFFVELNLLVGKPYDFFEIDEKNIKGNKKEGKMSLQNLYSRVGRITEYYGLVCNCLKNKPWKQSQVMTDQVKFALSLRKAFREFVKFLSDVGFSKDDIYNYYCRKHEVNNFRVESKY